MDADSKLCQLPNSYGKPTTQSKTFRNQQDTISRFNDAAIFKNDIRKHEVKYSPNTPVMLICAMCDGEVRRRTGTKKHRTVQVGFQSVIVACYRCKVCGTHYSGFLPHIKNDGNPDLEAKLVNYSGVR